jgi:hypothetical protein
VKPVFLAIAIAVLSAVEASLLFLFFMRLLVSPGGSGEFSGLNWLAGTLLALFLLPLPTFVITLALVMKYLNPQTYKDFRSLAFGLAVAIATIPLVSIFTEGPGLLTPWSLGINTVTLFLWTIVLLWRRVTRDEDDSFSASA